MDAERTSPYRFYQFWLNTADEDAERYVKIFTVLSVSEIEELIKRHRRNPHLRELQKTVAREITIMTHGRKAYEAALEASDILFGNATSEILRKIDEKTFLDIFEGVPRYELPRSLLSDKVPVVDMLAVHTGIASSKGEARRSLKGMAVSLNKEKIGEDRYISTEDLINGKYLLLQNGKKNYYLIVLKA